MRNVIDSYIRVEMPSPTIEEQNDVSFKAIWDIIKSWDVNVPEYYYGYCSANGSHVKLILDELNNRKCLSNRLKKLKRLLNDDKNN